MNELKQDRFKFRIFDKKLNKMSNWGDNPYHNMEIMNYICVDTPVTDWKHEDYVLMQCTGLRDKNNNLIYEGDILKRQDGIEYPIKWNYYCYSWGGVQVADYEYNKYFEVIGNIYENKE